MGLDEFLGPLMTHEITLKSNKENDERKKKKKITFKTSSSQINKEIKDYDDRNEDMSLFTRKFNKLFEKG